MPPAGTTTDNVELWKHLVINQQEIISLQRNQLANQESVARELANIKDILSQARGGWRVFVGIGSVVALGISALAWVWLNVLHNPR